MYALSLSKGGANVRATGGQCTRENFRNPQTYPPLRRGPMYAYPSFCRGGQCTHISKRAGRRADRSRPAHATHCFEPDFGSV